MKPGLVEKIVEAVLYEGYILYPYRPSAVKNRRRFNFGALTPRSYSEAQGGTEAWRMLTECLVEGGDAAALDVKVRFLHPLAREVGRLPAPLPELPEGAEPAFEPVASLAVGEDVFQAWQETVEREAELSDLNLSELVEQPRRLPFAFPASRSVEALREAGGPVVGVIVREQQAIKGALEVAATHAGERLFKVNARVVNLTPLEDAGRKSRDEALMLSFVSTHTVLRARAGEFVSLLDPPEALREAAAACRNVGTYPVLVGEEGERGVMLSRAPGSFSTGRRLTRF